MTDMPGRECPSCGREMVLERPKGPFGRNDGTKPVIKEPFIWVCPVCGATSEVGMK